MDMVVVWVCCVEECCVGGSVVGCCGVGSYRAFVSGVLDVWDGSVCGGVISRGRRCEVMVGVGRWVMVWMNSEIRGDSSPVTTYLS